MKTTRRTFLGGLAAVSVPASAVVADDPANPSIDAFLAVALPAEKARYHVDALAKAMADLHPDYSWRGKVDHEHHFAFAVGEPKIEKSSHLVMEAGQ